jgi:hypothetical protein
MGINSVHAADLPPKAAYVRRVSWAAAMPFIPRMLISTKDSGRQSVPVIAGLRGRYTILLATCLYNTGMTLDICFPQLKRRHR